MSERAREYALAHSCRAEGLARPKPNIDPKPNGNPNEPGLGIPIRFLFLAVDKPNKHLAALAIMILTAPPRDMLAFACA